MNACQRALTERRTLFRTWFERRAAYYSDRSVELLLRPFMSSTAPLVPSSFCRRLHARGKWLIQRTLTRFEAGRGLLERLKRRVALEELRKLLGPSFFRAKVIVVQTASTEEAVVMSSVKGR